MANKTKNIRDIVFIRIGSITVIITVLSFIITAGIPVLVQWWTGNLDDLWYLWLILSFAISTWIFFITGFIEFRNKLSKHKVLQTDYHSAFSKIINAIDNNNDLEIQKYSEHLNAIVNMHENLVEFKPDSATFEALHTMKGALSITDAHPLEWLNPTYNFFLISHYVSVIHQSFGRISNDGCEKITFEIVNRDSDDVKSFFSEGVDLLKELSEIKNTQQLQEIIDGNHLRFYILDKETIKKNSGVINLLIAGHEMFGIHLYIIDRKIYNILHREKLYKEVFNSDMKDDTVLDAMFSLDEHGQLTSSIAQIGTLVTNPNKRKQNQQLQEFVKGLAGSLCNDTEYTDQYLLYPFLNKDGKSIFNEKEINDFKIILNESKCHICLQKTITQ